MNKVIVFGSINVDYVAQVDRLPGPGETIKTDSYVFLTQVRAWAEIYASDVSITTSDMRSLSATVSWWQESTMPSGP